MKSMVEIREEDFKKFLSILGDRETYCVFGGRPEWNEEKKRYMIPPSSPRKKTDWLDGEAIFDYLKGNLERQWTTWVSLNDKEVGEDKITGVKKIYCLWFDFDAEREDKGQPATQEQRQKAYEKAKKFKEKMEEMRVRGFMACSGNGYHVFFPVNGYELRVAVFRKEFNKKQKAFYKSLREKLGMDFDTTQDIKRVVQPIGFPNMKIPDSPLETYWVDEFDAEDIKQAREKNESFIDAILNTELQEVTKPETVTEKRGDVWKRFNTLMEHNQRVKMLFEGGWKDLKYKSRSHGEMALVTVLCRKEFTDDEIKEIMAECKIGKWQEKPESYKDLTIEKGRKFVSEYGEPATREEEVKERKALKKTVNASILDWIMSEYTFITTDDSEDIYVYENGIYRPAENLIKANVEEVMKDDATTYYVSEIINHIKRRTYVPRSLFNAEKELLPVKNGLVDLTTFELKPFDQSKIFTFQLPVEYDPSADSPAIKKFISEICREGDIPILQEFLGYCLYADMPAHKSLWLYGTGRNGKSTLVRLMRMLLGDSCVASVMLEELDGSRRFTEARLFGKLANIIPEPSSERWLGTVYFKKLTGGDTISAEIKNKQNTIDFMNFAKFIIHGNRFPPVSDTSIAFWERLIVIEFPNVFIKNAIPNYENVLVEKDGGLSGFLNWCLEGLERLRRKNFQFTESKTSEDTKTEFMRVSNSPKYFLSTMCEFQSDAYVTKSELYDAYKDQCDREGLPIAGKNFFAKVVGETPHVYSKRKKVEGKVQRCWIGIKLKTEKEQEEEDQTEEKNICDACGYERYTYDWYGALFCKECWEWAEKKDHELDETDKETEAGETEEQSVETEDTKKASGLEGLVRIEEGECAICGEKKFLDHIKDGNLVCPRCAEKIKSANGEK